MAERPDDVMFEVLECATCHGPENVSCAVCSFRVHTGPGAWCVNAHPFLPQRVLVMRDWSSRLAAEHETEVVFGS